MRRVFLATLMGTAVSPAFAVDDYDTCVAMIADDPARAEREAGDWARYGGGASARHCYALALIEVGAPLRAADELHMSYSKRRPLFNNLTNFSFNDFSLNI